MRWIVVHPITFTVQLTTYYILAQKDKTCACIVSHTYKQIRRLWELPKDKELLQQNGGVYRHRDHGGFDDDMDLSTSSSCGKHYTTMAIVDGVVGGVSCVSILYT